MIKDKKTKIVATIGPATESKENMAALIRAGMNVARLNFSHGSHDEHLGRLKVARELSEELNTPVAVLQDLCGPKIRIGDFTTETVMLKDGAEFILTTEELKEGTVHRVAISYKNLHKEIKEGATIFLNDGKIRLQVRQVKGHDVITKVISGGEIKGRRGVNLPGAYLKINCLTGKDLEDVKWGIKHCVDLMALSFVRRASDIEDLRAILKKAKADIHIVAKIETEEAVENLDEIIAATDAVMVARGDLAVEIPSEQVPIIQKLIVKKCNALGKPVIVATQMLGSMTTSSTATRAEINDVANAILDGTDAVMLSEETTVGKHPEQAVNTMTRVALHTEKYLPYEEILKYAHLQSKDVTESISHAVVSASHELDAKVIIALTMSGFTARMIARHKPSKSIMALTPEKSTYRRLALSFNCYPLLIEKFDGITHSVDVSKREAVKHHFAKKGDVAVIAAGIPFSQPGNTNLLLVQKI